MISPASSTADKISPNLTYPNQSWNLKKIPVLGRQAWGTFNLLHYAKCKLSNQYLTSSFTPTHQLSFKTIEKKKPLPSKFGTRWISWVMEKVNQASDPESGGLNSEDAPPKLVKWDSDNLESIGCTPRHSDGFCFMIWICTRQSTHKISKTTFANCWKQTSYNGFLTFIF